MAWFQQLRDFFAAVRQSPALLRSTTDAIKSQPDYRPAIEQNTKRIDALEHAELVMALNFDNLTKAVNDLASESATEAQALIKSQAALIATLQTQLASTSGDNAAMQAQIEALAQQVSQIASDQHAAVVAATPAASFR